MRNVVIGFLGVQLDFGKNRHWRPTVQLCTQPGFQVDRLELIYDPRHQILADKMIRELARLSPDTEIRPVLITMNDPWDFQEVYGKLYDFAADYGFDEDREHYYVHLTTGTHVAQICWFLLTESRHIPAKFIQTGPPRPGSPPGGSFTLIDLDLSRYNALQRRFEAAAREHSALLLGGIETGSPIMQQLADQLHLVATEGDDPILLLGAAGTGKSTLATGLYRLKLARRRIKGRLVHVDCAALPQETALAALVGQRRAGFSASQPQDRPGFLREAEGGVLLLDHVDALPFEAQAALLQALETGRYCPIGTETEISAHVRLIATGTQTLTELAHSRKLRCDLLARLSHWHFHLPPLRERRGDIRHYVPAFIDDINQKNGRNTGFNADAMARYLRFATGDDAGDDAPWHGNLRDLKASIARLVLLAERGRITALMVDAEITRLRLQWAALSGHTNDPFMTGILAKIGEMDEFDRVQLTHVIHICRNSKSLSAAGRRLFAASRSERATRNDADRLRKYLARFNLEWGDMAL